MSKFWELLLLEMGFIAWWILMFGFDGDVKEAVMPMFLFLITFKIWDF